MICCDSCQEWFHGDCVGISETQGCKMEKKGQEYICPPCTTKRQHQSEPQPGLDLSFPECVTLSPCAEEGEGREEQQTLKEAEEEEAAAMKLGTEPEPESEMESSLPLCIGPQCSKEALPDSVYCGTDCILQHAAVTMKTLSVAKAPKSRIRSQRKAVAARPSEKGQRSVRMSKRLAGKAEESEEEDMKEDDGGNEDGAAPITCNPSLTEVQTTSIPSSKFYTASQKDNKKVTADSEDLSPSTQSPEDNSTDAVSTSEPVSEPATPQIDSLEKAKEPVDSDVSQQQSSENDPSTPSTPANSNPSQFTQSTTSATRHHETGALIVTKTAYVIPKKQSGPQPQSVSTSASSQKSSSAPTLLNETRNLPVPPAPSAPSSRPSQPNNQVRQSIQRSLTSILFKRVSDCEDLEMSESDAAKLVANVEMEMFDIFQNTDSKYMNKYRTIMFNIKDPKNKGLLYRVVRGEISPFRLVRMSQKDMQATKAPEPSPKETPEVKDAAAKTTNLQLKPEAVKVDLPSLNPARLDRRSNKRPDSTVISQEQKKSLPATAVKTRTLSIQGNATPDVLMCMLKDTTSEHKTHLFDLKCKICTGQIPSPEEEEPAKKKPKVSETREKHESYCRKSAEDDSPLHAPPDSPDMDSSMLHSPVLTIAESPASPIMDSPASPILESPTSPVSESPASLTPDAPKATTRKKYAPVVIPAVSTVSITRRDPRTAANRFSASSSSTSGPSTSSSQSACYAPLKETSPATSTASASSIPPTKTMPKSILMKPSSSADPRLYGTLSRTMMSEAPSDGETTQFLAKQEILWKGFLNMLTVAKFVTKGYLVSGSAENLKADLPDTIQIGGRIMPQTVWDYVAKLKTSVTKELCVIRFQPATEEEEVAYVSLFSYFSSRGRFGVVANNSHSIKDVYLVPLSAKESIPSILQPFEGPGLEKNRPNLLLGLAIIQKAKRPGSLPQEIEEKRPRVQMPKDPMWIPKPPVLYGSDKLEIFQPYDPETPASATHPESPSCPGSPSDTSSSGSVSVPSLLSSFRATTPVSTSVVGAVTQSASSCVNAKNSTTSSDKTPLQCILKTLFGKAKDSSDGSSATTTTTASAKKNPVLSQVSGSMVDPIVQQFGQKSKVKEVEEENDFDRPYDPEDEYNPTMGFGMVASDNTQKNKSKDPVFSSFVDDDVAYDPEDETIFEDIQNKATPKKAPAPTQTSDSQTCSTQLSAQVVAPAHAPTPVQTSTPTAAVPNLPTGTVVVSAATLTEQQRMLEELNKQIEEQKRQLKEQEEALRQQREAVGMFMAHFSVSDSLMSPPSKSLPIGQLSSLQSGAVKVEKRASESMDETSSSTETVNKSNVEIQSPKLADKTAMSTLKIDTKTVKEQDETQENAEDSDKYSAGEIEDSDVAYDPEDESLFNEIQDDVFQGVSGKTRDSSGRSSSRKGSTSNSYYSRKRRQSPKKRSHRERDHRSPSRKSQHRSPSHSRRRRERDRHRRSERDRSRHRPRNQSERHGRHHKEQAARRHSRGRKRSPTSPRTKDSGSLSPKKHMGPSPEVLEESKHKIVECKAPDSVVGQFIEGSASSVPVKIEHDPNEHQLKGNLSESMEKDFAPNTQELLHNVKLENTEPSKSHDLQKNVDSGSSAQVNKPLLPEALLSKIESTVPLREIDPPIRDSPQSPDPEPQFLKPSNKEKNDSVHTEEVLALDTHKSVSMPFVNIEKNYLSVDDKPTISNKQGPIVGSTVPNVKSLEYGAPNLQGPGVSSQCMVSVEKQLGEENPDLKHPAVMGQCGGHANLASGPHIQGTGPDLNSSIWGSGSHIQRPRTGSQISEPNMREAGIQQLSSDIIGPGPFLNRSEMRSPMPDKSLMGESGQHSEKADVNMTGPDIRASESRNLSSPIYHLKGPKIEMKAPDIIGRGRAQKDRSESPHTEGMRSAMMGRGIGALCRDIRTPGSSFRDSRGALRSDKLPPSLSDERESPQKRKDDFVLGPKSNLSHESNMPCIGHHNSEPRGHFKQSTSDHRTERTVQDLDAMHEPRKDDMTRGSYMGPDQAMDYLADPNTRDGRNEPHRRSSSGDIREMSLNRRDADWQGRNMPGLERRNEQISQEDRCPMPNIINPDWRGPGPGVVSHTSQNKSLGRHVGEPDGSGPGSYVREDWRGSVKGRPFTQDEWGVHHPDRSDPNMESQSSDFMPPGPERRGPGRGLPMQDRRGPGGPDFRRPESERSAPAMDNLRPGLRGRVDDGPNLDSSINTDRRGLGGPQFNRLGPERKGTHNAGQGPELRGPPGKDFRGPWPERRSPNMVTPRSEGTVPDMVGPGPRPRRGPGDPAGWGPGLERRGPAVEGPDRREHVGLDFKGPGPENRDLSVLGPGLGIAGPGGPNFRGPGPERRGLSVQNPGPDSRGPGRPNFRAARTETSGPAMEVVGPDRSPLLSCPGVPDFSGPWPDRRESVDPNFTGPGHERRGPAMEDVGPDGSRPGGPNFSGPGPGMRGPVMFPVRRESGDPSFTGPGHERRDLAMDAVGPDVSSPGSSSFSGTGHEWRGPFMEEQGLDRGPVDPNAYGLGPDKRRPHMRGPGPKLFRLGPERTDQCIEDLRPHRQRQGETHFHGPGPERRGPRGPNTGQPGLQHSDPNIEHLEPNKRHHEGPHFRGSGPERRPPEMGGTENSRNLQGGLQFRHPGEERRPPVMKGQEFNRRGSDFTGVGPEGAFMESEGKGPRDPDFRPPGYEFRGPDAEIPGPDRRESGGFREPGPERRGPNIEGQRPHWRRGGGRGRGIRQRGPDAEDLRHARRDDWGEADFGRSDPIHRSPDIESLAHDRMSQNLRVTRPMRRNFRGPGPNMSRLIRGEAWKGEDAEEPWIHEREPSMEEVIEEREYSGDQWERPRELPEEQSLEHSRHGLHSEQRGLRGRRPTPIHERPNMPFPGPTRGPEDEWKRPGYRVPGPIPDDPDMVCPESGPWGGHGNDRQEPDRGGDGPNRRGVGPFFRSERDQGMRGPESEGDPHMRSDWRQPDFRRSMRGPKMEGPDTNTCPNRRGGPHRIEGPDLRHPGPGADGRFLDCGGLGSERQGAETESHGPGRHEHDFRRERRGPGTDKCLDIRRGPVRWNSNDEVPDPDMRGIGPDSRGFEPPMKSDMQAKRYSDKSASFHFNSPHQGTRFQGPNDPHSAPFSGPRGSAPNSGGKSGLGFDSPQNQPTVKPQRHRGALLPTPTEGLIRLPNHMNNKPDAFSPKQKQMGYSTDMEWSTGRPLSQKRVTVHGQREEQEVKSALKTCVNASTGVGKSKETGKQGAFDTSVETKTNQTT
uniref:Death-inducer obliterator 1-like n=2 Tax=Echeneis naucrates TaxID=173247 RepID=A0A665V1Z3_ECHNA